MTESDWIAATDPQEMLRAVGTLSKRKSLLFAVAVCHRVSSFLDEIGTSTLAVVERWADDEVSGDEQEKAESLAWWWADGQNYEEDHVWVAAWATHAAIGGDAATASILAKEAARREGEDTAQSHLLRDIVGNPFHRPFIAEGVLAWNDGLIPKMAAAIFEDRDFSQERMGVLGDALEEAGVEDVSLLAHLRGPGPHVRGCHAVDAVLGKS